MATKITRDVLEAYLYCKTKAHLKLAGQQGNVSDYEALLSENRRKMRQTAISRIHSMHPEAEVVSDIPLTAATLRAGPPFVLDATLDDDLLSVRFDGMKKVDGPSKLGDFHYVPMLLHEGGKVGKQQRLLLEVYGLFLSQIQGNLPAYGLVWHGRECKATKVRLGQDVRKTERLLQEVKEMAVVGSTPRLILNSHCHVCEFRERCHDLAIEKDDLSLLRGLKEKEINKLNAKGIFTITQYSYCFRARRKRSQKRGSKKFDHSLQAMALRTKTIYVVKEPEFPPANTRVYLDVEGDTERGFYYLIGLLVCDGVTQSYIHFWADSPAQEKDIWERFLSYMEPLENYALLHYGSYEKDFLTQMKALHGCNNELFSRLISNTFNVLSAIYSAIYFPVHSNSLKSIAGFLGSKWTEDGVSGIDALVWRHEWEERQSISAKERLITYNREDCIALKVVADGIEQLVQDSRQGQVEAKRAMNIDEIQPERPRSFKRNQFYLPDMEVINRRAYFDYQRERVHFRTSASIRKALRREKRRDDSVLRANKVVFLEEPSHCPFCQHNYLRKNARRVFSKTIYDLKKTLGGIKRWICEYKTFRWRCAACDRTFLPGAYLSIEDRFGNGLKSWCVYKHIVQLQSYGSIVEELRELVGYRFRRNLINIFMEEVAESYRGAYEYLLANIKTFDLIFVDETKIDLRTSSGYVWVFASMEQVVYCFRETREGAFLNEVLADFNGVLVSDFYKAYDSIHCPQQKCLIHLMRDINEDLLKNPFEEELKGLARDFTVLMSSIVESIDRHGLKKHFLRKHIKPAQKFIDKVTSTDYKSEVCLHYKNRIFQNRETLFLFLQHDGVPWNNNIAEHAIKRIALLRRVIGGYSSLKGIERHLILMSIKETLKIHGISFWEYLRSGNKSVIPKGGRSGRREPTGWLPDSGRHR